MNHNLGWLSPFHRLLERVQARLLFPQLDRGQGFAEFPAHQKLLSQLLRALQVDIINNNSSWHAQQLSAIFADDKWIKVRSSAPMLSWIHALRQEGISIIPGDTATRSKVIVEMFRNSGMRGHSFPSLQCLCLRLAPTLYTVTQGDLDGEADHIFTETDPLSREHVSFGTDASERDCSVAHIGPHTLVTKTCPGPKAGSPV